MSVPLHFLICLLSVVAYCLPFIIISCCVLPPSSAAPTIILAPRHFSSRCCLSSFPCGPCYWISCFLLFADGFLSLLQHCFTHRYACLLHPVLTVCSSPDNSGQGLVLPQPVCPFSEMPEDKNFIICEVWIQAAPCIPYVGGEVLICCDL